MDSLLVSVQFVFRITVTVSGTAASFSVDQDLDLCVKLGTLATVCGANLPTCSTAGMSFLAKTTWRASLEGLFCTAIGDLNVEQLFGDSRSTSMTSPSRASRTPAQTRALRLLPQQLLTVAAVRSLPSSLASCALATHPRSNLPSHPCLSMLPVLPLQSLTVARMCVLRSAVVGLMGAFYYVKVIKGRRSAVNPSMTRARERRSRPERGGRECGRCGRQI